MLKSFKPLPNASAPRHVSTWRGFTVTLQPGTAERRERFDAKDASQGMHSVTVGAYQAVGVLGGKEVVGTPFETRGAALQSVYKMIDEALGEGVRRRAIKDANGHTVGTHMVRAHEAQRV